MSDFGGRDSVVGGRGFGEFGFRLVVGFVFGVLFLGFVSGVEVGTEEIIIKVNEQNQPGLIRSLFVSQDVIQELNITRQFSSFDGFAASVTPEQLRRLEQDSRYEVLENKEYHITLDVSAPEINATNVNNLEQDSVNLTGLHQTVCIIDTGVDYTHANLGNGCYGDNDPLSSCKIIGGYDFVNNDANPMDDQGHGTHVAGIISSNHSTYKGVAPDVKIIAIKVLNSEGIGNSADIISGIEWCTNNASRFNITTISMSLGDGTYHNTYCNSDSMSASIWDATGNNISVVVSTGNCLNATGQYNESLCDAGISAPACVEGVIPVGASSGSSTIEYQRGLLWQVLAPGINICSARLPGDIFGSVCGGGTFIQKSGTSMSAPHVSAAIAILNQFQALQSNPRLTNQSVITALNTTNVRINDSGGTNLIYPRINILDAIFSLDTTSPNVTLVSPVDGHVNLSVNHTFTCNATDWQLANVTLKVWNSSELYYNESVNLSGTENETSFSLTNIPLGNYDWNCFAYDDEGNLGGASSNFSLTVGGVEVGINSPDNNSHTNVNETNFNCSSSSDAAYELTNISFNLWNSSGYLLRNETKNISGFDNVSVFNYTFLDEGDYLWECVAVNNNSDVGNGINFSISYDATAPVISSLSESVTTSSGTISWTTDESANSSVAVSGGAWSNSSSYVTSHSVSVSSLSSSVSYSYVVTSCDEAGNCGNDSGSFTTSAVVSSGGGGGGGSSIKTISVKASELWEGKSESLRARDKMSFSLVSGSHSLRVESVGSDSANIVIESDPIYLSLNVGEEVKLNLSSDMYYDLLVRLNGISGGRANVSVMRIFETIFVEEVLNKSERIDDDRVFRITEELAEDERDLRGFVWVGVVLVGVVALMLKRKKVKGKKVGKKRKKNGKQNKKVKA